MRQKGSIVKRDNTYSAVYGDPKVKNAQGNKKQRWRSFPTREAAEAFLDAQLGAIRAHKHIAPTQDTWSTLFAKFEVDWLQYMVRVNEISPATAAGYRSAIRKHLLPYWGELRVMDMTATACQDWAIHLATATVADQPIANKSMTNIINVFSKVCHWAKVKEFTTAHWVRDSEVVRPSAPPKSIEEEALMILDEIEATKLRDFWLDPEAPTTAKVLSALGLIAGLRRGEIAGLPWGAILWEKHQIRVAQAVSAGVLRTTAKSDASRAHIDVPRTLLVILQEHEDWLKAQGRPVTAKDFVLQDLSEAPPQLASTAGRKMPGRMFHPDTLGGDYWENHVRKPLELREGLGLHALRHTYASSLIKLGENHKYVQRQMRHATVQITLDVYGHLFPTEGREAMARLENALTPKVLQFTGTRPRF